MQAKDKDKEANGTDVQPRRMVHLELSRPPRDTRLENRLPSVSIATAGSARVMGSRAAASASERQQRASSLDEVGIAYSHSNEPWQMYAWPFIIDRGFARARYLNLKFATHVLYLETERCAFSRKAKVYASRSPVQSRTCVAIPCCEHPWHTRQRPATAELLLRTAEAFHHQHFVSCSRRYEVALSDSKTAVGDDGDPLFKLSFCKRNHPEDLLAILGVPIPAAEKQVLCSGLPWHCYQVRTHS